MKKLATILLVAILAVACLGILTACNKPLANEGAHYVLAGGHPGWGVDGFDPDNLDDDVAKRVMEPIAKNDPRVASIKDQLKDAKYLYIVEWTFEGEAGWSNDFVMNEGEEAQAVDGNCLVKVIMYTLQEEDGVEAWTPTWYSSPEAGAQTKSLTPDTLWEPQFASAPADGTSDWNSNGVLLNGVGHYYIVFAEFNDGTFGIAAIEIAD